MAVSGRDMVDSNDLLADLLTQQAGGGSSSPPRRQPRPKGPPPPSIQDLLRGPYLVILSYVGLGLSLGSTIIVALQAEAILRGSSSFVGVACGGAVAALLTAGQWAYTPFHRSGPYRLGMLAFYLICLAPDVAISLSQLWHYVAGPLVTRLAAPGTPLYWFFGAIIGILCAAASIGPEAILFPRRK